MRNIFWSAEELTAAEEGHLFMQAVGRAMGTETKLRVLRIQQRCSTGLCSSGTCRCLVSRRTRLLGNQTH